jgi:transposase
MQRKGREEASQASAVNTCRGRDERKLVRPQPSIHEMRYSLTRRGECDYGNAAYYFSRYYYRSKLKASKQASWRRASKQAEGEQASKLKASKQAEGEQASWRRASCLYTVHCVLTTFILLTFCRSACTLDSHRKTRYSVPCPPTVVTAYSKSANDRC